MQAATIIIADDHPLFRNALRQAIESLSVPLNIESAGTFDEAMDLANGPNTPELILLDLKMPGSNGFSGLIRMRAEKPEIPVAVVSASEDDVTIARALEAGASGFIPKSGDADCIKEAIDTILSGSIWYPPGVDLDRAQDENFSELLRRLHTLTPQQSRVLGMIAEGMLNKQIAFELGVSEATIKAHVSAILAKLHVDSRTQAVIALSKLGLPEEPGAPVRS